MMETEQQTKVQVAGQVIEDNLNALRKVLDREHKALLDGDAKLIASLATEKEQISEVLETVTLADENAPEAEQLRELAASVSSLAQLNHALLKQMYQHYHGMLELFMRMAGQSTTYGKDGMISVGPKTLKDSQVLA